MDHVVSLNKHAVRSEAKTDGQARPPLCLFYLCTWCRYWRKTSERLSQTAGQMVSGM